jgi:hypothetical protein
MPETPKRAGNDELWLTLTKYTAAIVAVVVALIPTLGGIALWRFGLSRLGRRENLIVAVAAFTALTLDWTRFGRGYLVWLFTLRNLGWQTVLGAPWPALAVWVALVGASIGIATGTRVESAFLARIGRNKPDLLGDHANDYLPTLDELNRVDSIVAKGVPLTINPRYHSTGSKDDTPGKREFPFALDRTGKPIIIREDELAMHGLIFGSSGSGKSVTIRSIAAGLLDLGWSGVILDLKEDTGADGLQGWCSQYAAHHALPYQELTLSGVDPRYWFNPIEGPGMGQDEARECIIAMNKFETPYYEALNKKMLGQLLTLMFAAHELDPVRHPRPNLRDIGVILSAPDLKAAVKERAALVLKSNAGFAPEDFQTLLHPTRADQEAAGGLGARITASYDSEAGRRILKAPAAGQIRPALDVTQPGLVYIGLDSTSKPDITRVIGTAVLSRIAAWASARIGGRLAGADMAPRFIIIDEANFINRKLMMALLSRVRGAKLAIIVCTQGPLDWRASNDEPGVEELVQNTNVQIIMSQGDRTSAEICSDIIGRERRVEGSQLVREGEAIDSGSFRATVDYRVEPDVLRSLGIGQMVMRIGKPSERITWGKVVVRDPSIRV